MKITYQTGVLGEQIAAEWLIRHKGMRLLEQRYRTQAGEIDLIMLDQDTVTFVEVKTRLNAAPGVGLLSIDRRKQSRVAGAAYLYLSQRHWLDRSVRFDVVEVSGDQVFHVPDAFQPGRMFF